MNLRSLAFAVGPATLCITAYAQVPPCTGPFPDHVYGTFGMDMVSTAAVAADGNVFVAGSIAESGGNVGADRYGGRDAIVLKLAPDGALIWSAILGGPADDVLDGVWPLPDGGCIATGRKGAIGWYLRILPAGAWIWESTPTFSGYARVFEQPSPTTVLLDNGWLIDINAGLLSTNNLPPAPDVGLRQRSPDGGFIFARTLFSFDVAGIWSGSPTYLGSGEDIGLFKTDAAGAVLWAKRIQSPSIDGFIDMEVLPDGYLILSRSFGSISGGDRVAPIRGLHDFWVIRTDLDGEILWERSYGSFSDDVATGMFRDADGNFVLHGRTEGPPTFEVTEPVRGSTGIGLDGWMLKIDASGNMLWDKRWGGAEADRLFAGVPIPGGYLMIGVTESDPGYDRTAPHWGESDIWAMRMLPGTPTTWYNDADADGYGDPASPVTACDPPIGYAANGLDCDPFAPNPTGNYFGAQCNDGNAFTFPDRVDASCECQGSIPDFLFDNLTFGLLPDAFAGNLSMSIFRLGEPNALLSFGPWPNAQPGVLITQQFQLPPGQYTMRVFDALGDGIIGGGFTLSVNGRRIIQADGAFLQTSEAPLGFELPLGGTSLTTASCDKLDLLPTSSIVASPNALVSERYDRADASTGYQFWIFNPHGGYSRRVYQSHRAPGTGNPPGPDACAHLRLASLQTNPVPQTVLLNVRVRPRIDGIYGAFGPACAIKVDPYAQACPTTKLVDQPGNPNFSCGAQRAFGGSSKVVANPVSGANKYQFEFAEPANGYLRRITSANNTRLLNWTTQQPLCGTFTYQVRVRVSFDGGQNWCPWGVACPVTIAHYGAGCTPVGELTEGGQRTMQGVAPITDVRVFPTLTAERRLWVEGSWPAAAELEVRDLAGSLVHRERITFSNARTLTPCDLPAGTAPGVYLVTITGGGQRQVERVVLE